MVRERLSFHFLFGVAQVLSCNQHGTSSGTKVQGILRMTPSQEAGRPGQPVCDRPFLFTQAFLEDDVMLVKMDGIRLLRN